MDQSYEQTGKSNHEGDWSVNIQMMMACLGNRRSQSLRGLLLVSGIYFCFGCSGPTMTIKTVHDEPSLMVGLTSNPQWGPSERTRYDQPVEIESATWNAIFKRLFFRFGKGFFESSRPVQPLFSSEEIDQIGPALSRTFKNAGQDEWVVFASWGSSKLTQELQVTSGAMFMDDGYLTIFIANFRERVTSEQLGIEAIHDNPLHPLKEVNERLVFRPPYYVIDSGIFWTESGFGPPVGKIILDYQALLDMMGQHESSEVGDRIKVSPSSENSPSTNE